jgi:hypothetical protein
MESNFSKTGVPSPGDQVAFLRQLQRVLEEGSFVATYKYALLHTIADLCVTSGDDSGAPLTLSTRQIAERFVELYWRQVLPFPAGEATDVLSQNTGRQAAIVLRVREARESYGGSLSRLKNRPVEWESLVRQVEQTVREMPLWRLQTVGEEQIEFLYANAEKGRTITLLPGVAYCFRAFYPMITDMVEGAWSHFVRRFNSKIMGHGADLRTFLFGSERGNLGAYRAILEDLQDGSCLYCLERLKDAVCVDHFIPWRRYPTDLGHNFVLAHDRCNGRKADRLAAEIHLRRWWERNTAHADQFVIRFSEISLPHDREATRRVAQWAYGQLEAAKGQTWLEGTTLEPLRGEWGEILRG